jgi:hypothetical protein
MAEEPHRLRGGRPAVQAYRSDQAAELRDFVPVEFVTKMAPAPARTSRPPKAAAAPRATEAAAAPPEPAAEVPRPAAAPAAFVIEPDPGWSERTSLFGDPEG